jgi:hypothetical protein
MKDILAIHIQSTAPARAKGLTFAPDRYDLYTAALSALAWRKMNGSIRLVADRTAAEFYGLHGLDKLWNGIDVTIPEDMGGINPITYWAGGKLLALSMQTAPVAMIDTDFIVWERLDFGQDVICAHREDITEDIYPDPGSFFMRQDYVWHPLFDYSVLPCNTAFLYLPDDEILKLYTGMALDFMYSSYQTEDVLCHMVFAEQRLLGMCAAMLGRNVNTLLDKDRLFQRQEGFTHLWGAKQVLRADPAQNELFCSQCRQRILSDFGEYAYVIDRIENLHQNEAK